MKEYWFTVASGPTYEQLASNLGSSLGRLGKELDIRRPAAADPRRNDIVSEKIDGILDCPAEVERIYYLDADTFVVGLDGFEQCQGALREPWLMGNAGNMFPSGDIDAIRKLNSALCAHQLECFAPGGRFYRQEFNSGVIVGSGESLKRLAARWRYWWDVVSNTFPDTQFRDQISFKYAYVETGQSLDGVPMPYNWIVKRAGFSPVAKVLHLAGWVDELKHEKFKRVWDDLMDATLRGEYRAWASGLDARWFSLQRGYAIPDHYEDPDSSAS